ncbi:Glucan endo-1 3-beta-glucosidase 12 [Bienertia sinuspersici]
MLHLFILKLIDLRANINAVIVTEAQMEEWCIADEQVPDEELQKALDWACATGADCTQIQKDEACFMPNTILTYILLLPIIFPLFQCLLQD